MCKYVHNVNIFESSSIICLNSYSTTASKKRVTIVTIFSVILSLTSHNSLSDRLVPILTWPSESEDISDSVCPLKIPSSISEWELWDVKDRVTENIVTIVTCFLLATVVLRTLFWFVCSRMSPHNIERVVLKCKYALIWREFTLLQKHVTIIIICLKRYYWEWCLFCLRIPHNTSHYRIIIILNIIEL